MRWRGHVIAVLLIVVAGGLTLGALGSRAPASTGRSPVSASTRGAVGSASTRGVHRPLIPVRPPRPRPLRVGSFGPGGWCWFADPRAIELGYPYHETLVGWIDWGGHVTVGSYDLTRGRVHESRVGRLVADDHGSPALLREPDGRITVFWSGHNGSHMYFRTSTAPGETVSWGPTRTLPGGRIRGGLGYTYPNPVTLPAEHNRLYLFWRGADWSADFAVREPSGRWTRARELIRMPGQRPYLKVDSNGRDKIAMAFTTAHPRNALTSVYYMSYRRGWLTRAGGGLIQPLSRLPVDLSRVNVVYDATRTGVPGWVWDVALGRDGRPVVVYATFPSPERHLYWYARYTGSGWVSHLLGVGGPTISPGTIEYEYSGGMALDHADPAVVYLSRKSGSHFQIERWSTSDGGASWRRQVVIRTRGQDDVRPVVPRGARGGPLSLLWLSGTYGTYTKYRTWVDFLH